jgi:molecular chaperone GrpE
MSNNENTHGDSEEVLQGDVVTEDTELAQEGDDLTMLLEDARSRADEHWNQLLRTQAEMENLKKRSQRDVENAHKFALERFAQDLLPVRDSMEMGISAADGENIDPASLQEGMDLTLKMLVSSMDKFGIQVVDPEGEKFNPDQHQAMSMQVAEGVEANTVLTVVQKGYLLNDRLLRPAMVIVSKAAE